MSPVVIVAAASTPVRNSSNIASPIARIELPGTNWTKWLQRRGGGCVVAAHPAGYSGAPQPIAGWLRALPCVLAHSSLYPLPFPATLYATRKALFTEVPKRRGVLRLQTAPPLCLPVYAASVMASAVERRITSSL